jgi:hypothetical protein
MRTTGQAITAHMPDFGGVLRCETCKRSRPLGSIGYKLDHGWPKCCGYTMRWWTQRQIDEGEMTG